MSIFNQPLALQFRFPLEGQIPTVHWRGRLDNRNDLLNTLNLTPDATDERLIEKAFEQFGALFPSYFLGDFALILLDPRQQQIYAARDYFGCKPLYYHYADSVMTFADTLPSLLGLIDKPAPNMKEILDSFTAIPAAAKLYTADTYFQGVQRLNPAHYLEITPHGLTEKPYWTLPAYPKTLNLGCDEDYLAAFEEKLERAVARRCEGVTATELSGGLDTGLIMTTLKRLNLPFETFSHIDLENENSEHPRIQDTVKFLSIPEPHWIDGTQFDIPAAIHHCEKIYAGGMPFIFFLLAQPLHHAVQQKGHRILLSGFGGDECVTGHASPFTYQCLSEHKYRLLGQELMAAQRFKGEASSYFKALRATLVAALRLALKGHALRPRSCLNPSSLYLLPQYYEDYHLPKKYINLLDSPFYETMAQREADYLIGSQSFHVRMRVEYSAILAQSFGFEYRYPLLDRELIEFCYSLPFNQKRREGKGRYLARRYLSHYLPPSVYNYPSKLGAIMPGGLRAYLSYFKNANSVLSQVPFVDLSKPDHPTLPHLKPFCALSAYLFRKYAPF